MAEFPALHLWTDAYLADTTHLTTLENGAYLLLLMAAWRSPGCRLPNDDKLLARFARLSPVQWQRIKPNIMAFWTVKNDHIYQGRLTDEYVAVKQHRKSQSRNAKARWLKNNETGDATASDWHMPNDASLTPTPTPTPIPTKDSPVDPLKAESINGAVAIQGKKKRATLLPEDWTLPQEWADWAWSIGFHTPEAEADIFKNHWLSAPEAKARKRDWQATWQMWIRREMKYERRGPNKKETADEARERRRAPAAAAVARRLGAGLPGGSAED